MEKELQAHYEKVLHWKCGCKSIGHMYLKIPFNCRGKYV